MDKHHRQFRRTNDTDSDIVNANLDKKLSQMEVIDSYDITLQWSTDGVDAFKS